jgi:adenylate kinase
MLREIAAGGGRLGRKIEQYIGRGRYAPTRLVTRLILERVRQLEGKVPGVVFSGSPRKMYEARRLDAYFSADGRENDLVFHLKISFAELKRRAATRWICRRCGKLHETLNPPPACRICGGELYKRKDDQPQFQRVRWREYEQHTLPVVKWYRQHTKVYAVSTMRPFREVAASIWQVVGPWWRLLKQKQRGKKGCFGSSGR